MSEADPPGRSGPRRWRRPALAVAVPLGILALVTVFPTLTLLGTDPCAGEDPSGCDAARTPSVSGPVPDGRTVARAGADEAASNVPAPGAMPTSRPGWKVTFADDFTGDGIDLERWGRYSGRPGGAPPTAVWERDHVAVRDGKLLLEGRRRGGRWVTAGVSMARAGARTYGRWDIRFRIQRGNGVGYAILLYPGDGGWPPEIDIAEDGGGLRTGTQATVHWGRENHQVHRSTSADFTAWHTVSVVWDPGRLRYLLDDAEWGRVESPHVPDEPMWLGLQTQQATCSARYRNCPLATGAEAVDMEVDWVVRWERAPAGVSLPDSWPGPGELLPVNRPDEPAENPSPLSAGRPGAISAEGPMRRGGPLTMGWT